MEPPFSRRTLLTAGSALGAAGLIGALGPAARAAASWPTVIPLPDGWRPEGIAIGGAPFAYVGSLADGSVYRADLATGAGKVVSRGTGAPTTGLKTDALGRLFACGADSGQLRVIDARGGAILKTYQAGSGDTFVNDVVLTPGAAWFTDSRKPLLYVLRLGRHGRLPDTFDTLPLSGDWEQAPAGVNAANGIARTPDGAGLLLVNDFMDGGSLVRVDPRTGAARRVGLGDTRLPNGDGLLLLGRTLYVVQNRQNAIEVLHLDPAATTGTAGDRLTDADFDVPTTAAGFRDRLYLPNARFSTTPTPETAYSVVAVRR